MASRIRFRYGHRPSEKIRAVNPEIRQYFEPDKPMFGPWSLWQSKPELPSTDEILGTDDPEIIIPLVANCVEGPWESKEEYLQSHYALLREDSVSPLRAAVAKLRADPLMNDTQDISVYEKVSPSSSHPFTANAIAEIDKKISFNKGLRHRDYRFSVRFGVAYQIFHSPRRQEYCLDVLEPSYPWSNCCSFSPEGFFHEQVRYRCGGLSAARISRERPP